MTPASPVLPTVTVHSVGRLCVPALKGTTELLENLQKWNVLVSLMFFVLVVESRACSVVSSIACLVWGSGVGLGVGVREDRHQMFLAT